ncbi:hypothetical protein Dimus_017686, partial [Dionaea muscipula]
LPPPLLPPPPLTTTHGQKHQAASTAPSHFLWWRVAQRAGEVRGSRQRELRFPLLLIPPNSKDPVDKFLRRKYVKWCIFSPYFDSEKLGIAHFAAVHKVFGASNASNLLQGITIHRRLDAVVTLCYEALARVRDPAYGYIAHIFSLQQQTCHSLGVMHRHLKSENLLLVNKDDDFPLKAIDFGHSVFFKPG